MKYKIGGHWGHCVFWINKDQFKKKRYWLWTIFNVHGHHQRPPRVGDLLTGEFENSVMTFKFTSVKVMRDPRDQFFGSVRIVKQASK